MELSFYDHINNAEKYICDRCKVAELREDEYLNNRKNDFIYCDECWNWIHLQTWTDETGKHTLRSERKVIL